MEKRFDHIISLGLNCEISFILKKKFNFVESSLLSWSYIPISSLNDVLKNPQLIFSEGIEDLTEYNMFKCSKTGIAFHGKTRQVLLRIKRTISINHCYYKKKMTLFQELNI